MTDPGRIAAFLLLFVALIFMARGSVAQVEAPAGLGAQLHPITAQERDGVLRFDPSVGAGNQRVVYEAIATARPDAQRLIGIVDGLVTVHVGTPQGGAAGLTESGPSIDGYRVTLDLDRVYQHMGKRGLSRLVLHELGHVIDHALLDPAIQTTLDAGIPAGVVCEGNGSVGACANREERFAETFAKWATGDVGHNLYLGYKVPPPPQLDAWGTPLTSVQ